MDDLNAAAEKVEKGAERMSSGETVLDYSGVDLPVSVSEVKA